jgi:hypothetical protein
MKMLVAGRFASVPAHGGATWAVLQYALGLRQMGHDVVLVDPCERDPDRVAYYEHVVALVGLQGAAALVHPDRTATGLDYRALASWVHDCHLLVNLAGVLGDEELTGPAAVRAYVDLDPAFTQFWHSDGIDVGLARHDHYLTVGRAIGTPSCSVPTCGLPWTGTVPPVVLNRWPATWSAARFGVTTVANWRSYGSIQVGDVLLGQKAHAVRTLMDLPRRLPNLSFEPAFAIHPAERRDLEALALGGWRVLSPDSVAADPDRYRTFVRASSAELGVAKSGYTVSRCGWFSDRSACYLASGRPVVAEDTGWTQFLPSGEGLLSFADAESAAEALERVFADYDRHRRAARALACEVFDSRRVLGQLLEQVGATE